MYLEEYARQHGMRNIRHFSDDGYSGTNFNRPGFEALLEEIEAGHVAVLIVKDLSRFGGIYNGTLFQNEATFHERCYHLSEQLFLQSVLDQQVPEPAKGMPVRNLVAGIDTAELRKCAAVDGFCYRGLATQVIEVLQQMWELSSVYP